MCVNVEIDITEETVASLEALSRALLVSNDVNYTTITESFDDNIDGTIDGLTFALGSVVTDVFITDPRGLKRYVVDLLHRWDIDECSMSILQDDVETKRELVIVVGDILVNSIIVKAITAFINDM